MDNFVHFILHNTVYQISKKKKMLDIKKDKKKWTILSIFICISFVDNFVHFIHISFRGEFFFLDNFVHFHSCQFSW